MANQGKNVKIGQADQGEERADQQVLRSLRRIFHAVDRHSRVARQHGLTEPQAICLNAVKRAGEVNPGQLARSVSLSPPTVTGILDRLERRDLVKRERIARDKRQVTVRLTEAGEELLEQSPPSLQEQFKKRLSALPNTRQRRIADALEEVVRLMEAEDIDAAPLLARGAANLAHADPAFKYPNTTDSVTDPTDAGL